MRRASDLAAVAGLLLNAAVWGCSWWLWRRLALHGIDALWATALVYALGGVALLAWRPRAAAALARAPGLWWVAVASGLTNAAFNVGVTRGDVVRVVLLFYLMPLWALLLARWLLGERIDAGAWLRVALALLGAGVVLWPGEGFAAPSLADGLGLLGGIGFALNNVLLLRYAASDDTARALAMFAGGPLVGGVLAALLAWLGAGPWIAVPPGDALFTAGLLAASTLTFLAANLGLQYGAARLPAQLTAVVMTSEVVFASASALLLGAAHADARTWIGGSLIVLAVVLAARRPSGAPGGAQPQESPP